METFPPSVLLSAGAGALFRMPDDDDYIYFVDSWERTNESTVIHFYTMRVSAISQVRGDFLTAIHTAEELEKGSDVRLLGPCELKSYFEEWGDVRTVTLQHSEKRVPMVVSAEEKEPVRRTIKHIDNWLDFEAISDVMGTLGFENADYVHFMLDYFRRPAWVCSAHARFMNKYGLFVDYEGKTYKVTGASRLGDIFLAKDLKRPNKSGYDLRVDFDLSKLTNWRDTP